MTTTQLPKAPSGVPPHCYRDEDGNICWLDDQGYYNAMCDGWDPGVEFEWYAGFSEIGVGEDAALVLVTQDWCDPVTLDAAEADLWEGFF